MMFFELPFHDDLHRITPAELIKKLFACTHDRVLYVKGVPMDPDDERDYIYRCVMNWSEEDCLLSISELTEMRPEAEPEGFFSEEILFRGRRLRDLMSLHAPRVVIRNEANLLTLATVLNRFARHVEIVRL